MRSSVTENLNERDQIQEVDLNKLFERIFPYWPILLVCLILVGLSGWTYLRYSIPRYALKTRVVVYDQQREGGPNLFEALQMNFNDIDKATERELANLQSKSLITDVVRELGINIQWISIGRIKNAPVFGNSPIKVWLSNPDSVKYVISDQVIYMDDIIQFAGMSFIPDSTYKTSFGQIKFSILDKTALEKERWALNIRPLSMVANEYHGKLSAKPLTKQSPIVDLQLTDELPERGLAFLDQLLDNYVEKNIEFKNRTFENSRLFIENRLALLSKELGDVEGQLEDYKSKRGIIDLSTEGKIFLEEINRVDKQKSEIEIQLEVIGKIENYVRNRNSELNSAPATLGLSDPVLIGLLEQLYEVEFQLNRLEKVSGIKNPEINVIKESEKKLKESIINSLSNLKITLNSTLSQLKGESSKLAAFLKDIPQKEKALLEISRQQQIKNNIYIFLLQKREEAALSAAAQVSTLTVIDKPELMGRQSPKPVLIYGVFLFIGLVLSSIIIWLKEFRNSKVQFKSDLEKTTGLTVMGELVLDKSSKDNMVDFTQRSMLAEQFREFRTNLGYIPYKGECRIFLVTSSIPGEGKSFISGNLGASLALTGKKVALLEFDLRKPKLLSYLGMKRDIGLTNYLLGMSSLDNILKPVDNVSDFYVISSGPLPPNPAELILNGKIEQLIEELKSQFDYVIIDSPPLGSVADAKLLGKYSDYSLYLVRHNYTPTTYLDLIKEVSEKAQIPQPYLVFNAVNKDKIKSYGYGYGYGYGYLHDEKRFSFWDKIGNFIKSNK